jgi:muramoyltetrapeptide carboxypeptidase
MIQPPKLTSGATLGIVSPSWWLKPEILEQSAALFTARGYRLVMGKTTRLKDHQFAGSPQARAADLMAMFTDPQIDAIVCARGGYGANRVLPLLDYEAIRRHPKIFVGYSDVTALLTSITQRTGLVTFHGPMLITYQDGPVDYNFEAWERALRGGPFTITPPAELKSRVLRAGVAEGPLWGGNLTLLANRLATPDQLDPDGAILFLEDVHEYYYAFDRLLYHLRQTGSLDRIRGLIIGELTDMKDSEIPFGRTTDEIVWDVCGDLDIPIVTNFPCGHGKYQATLPLSVPARLTAADGDVRLDILESPVRIHHFRVKRDA